MIVNCNSNVIFAVILIVENTRNDSSYDSIINYMRTEKKVGGY